MSEFTPESTDRLSESTNPSLTNVVLEGNLDITLSVVAGGYRGSNSIQLPLDTDYANLDIEAWARFQTVGGGDLVSYHKIPFTEISSAGAITKSSWFAVEAPTKENEYYISFVYFSTTPSNSGPTIYYRLNTNKIAPDGLSFI